MKVDVEALGRFNRMAHEGASRAADRLAGLTGIETFVGVTKTDFVRADELPAGERVGVEISLDGALTGRTLLAFPPESADRIAAALPSGGDGRRSLIGEVGNVLTSGFVDGWADCFEATVDISPPTYVEGGVDELLRTEDAAALADHALVFESRAEAFDDAVDFQLYMVPDPETLALLVGDGSRSARALVDFDRLSAFKELAHGGAATVADQLTTMTGIETVVDLTRLAFVPVENAPAEISAGEQVGVVFELSGVGGYVMVLFDESSARALLGTVLPDSGADADADAEPDDAFSEMERSALAEVGNVVTSGFVDGWANLLGTTIDISTPTFVHDVGPAIIDPVAARLGQRQEFVFVFDTSVRADAAAFDCRIYALPDEAGLREALAALSPRRLDEARADASRYERTEASGPLDGGERSE